LTIAFVGIQDAGVLAQFRVTVVLKNSSTPELRECPQDRRDVDIRIIIHESGIDYTTFRYAHVDHPRGRIATEIEGPQIYGLILSVLYRVEMYGHICDIVDNAPLGCFVPDRVQHGK
jgi:hypothetical protein